MGRKRLIENLREQLRAGRALYAAQKPQRPSSDLAKGLVGLARELAVLERGAAAVNAEEPRATHSTCKSFGRGQKDRVLSFLASHGMVRGYRMDSGEADDA